MRRSGSNLAVISGLPKSASLGVTLQRLFSVQGVALLSRDPVGYAINAMRGRWGGPTRRQLARYRSRQIAIMRGRHTEVEAIRPILEGNSVELGSRQNLGLGALLVSHGSDKATVHDYDAFYEDILSTMTSGKEVVVEVGIGSNDPSIPSNMGVDGVPGAALRAFRDALPNAIVFGADVDRNCLIEEERITCFWVDQRVPATFTEFTAAIQQASGASLVVVDGLHTPEADLNTLIALLPTVRVGGYLAIEDISEVRWCVDEWIKVLELLRPEFYKYQVLRTRRAMMIVIERVC